MSKTIEMRDVGPIEHLVIPVPEGGGIVVLRGDNGQGKSHALEAVSALVGGGKRIPSRDGSLGAQVEGLGARLTVGRRMSHSGELEISSLEGEDPSLLVDPGIKSPEAADAARVRALLRLARATVDVEAFGALVGGLDRLQELCRPASLADRSDATAMAAAVKRDLEAAARQAESASENALAKASGVRSTLAGLESDSAARMCATAEDARTVHTRAIREHAAAESRRTENAAALSAAREAREALAQHGDDGTAESLEHAARMAAKAAEGVEDLRAKLRAAERACDDADAALARQQRASKQRAPLERAIAAAADVREVDQAEVDQLADAVEAAELELHAWSLHEKTRHLSEEVDRLEAQGRKHATEGAALRHAAQGTERVVLDAVRSVCGDDMELHDGRLYVSTDRGKELFCELSHGERWRKALDIAVSAVGGHGLLVVRQEAYESLSPRNRHEVSEIARELGVVILTAEASDGALRAEREDSAAVSA